ncbi:DNA cytosine methyltransferase [Sphingobacterium siyangense]|uniref:Cytosine-specific methyltransferase n=1 Tax=Sphingobacterium siyangense TaxID=459529 RepID=A0A562M9M5_9SPHI|nr:DNA (cytosine-5-)-methyltransferase [Sphingobacterium siyangense]TWI16590.1 DNA (cytosine-5)-methyltransferase 1 [Sphingobacterium siyangense]
MSKNKIGVIDLFCGIGGLSYGMYKSGFDIIAGYDIDGTCSYAYEQNNNSVFHKKDVSKITGAELSKLFDGYKIKVLAGCAPCQPFSSYAFKVKDKDKNKYNLLYQFGRLVEETLPDIVTMENVSQIESFNQKPVLLDFVSKLENMGYHISYKTVFCPDYGIPQTRKRLVLLASKLGEISLIEPTHTKGNYVTVADAIEKLPPIKAGETYIGDPLHRSRSLNELNLTRIKATPYGGGWKDWPEELRLECHKKDSGKSFGSVYGRMVWEEPSPTMTTLCTGLGNGRFGHPVQDRAISVREAAILQTFPNDYRFFENEAEISISKASRYIGNAVPPKLGEVTAESIKRHLKELDQI